MTTQQYEKFSLIEITKKARNYLTSMVDRKYHFLPYWFVQINIAPAYAKHVRVDDAELVASWYEAIVSVCKILGEDKKMKEVEEGFKYHLLKSWGPKGLRYHEDYPWSNTNHASFHEMSYILGALNRWLEEEPDNKEVEIRASNLVRGMRELVVHRKIKTFWSGDYPFGEKIYEFPGDIYLKDKGWVSERVTGRGEESIRNAMMLHSLVVRAEKFKDEVALDLAEGIANHLLTLSRYFNWKGEFFGHIHSAIWFASGLARLSRLINKESYAIKANNIYNYVRSISSEFGWVPEYAQWHPMSEEHCETCCVKDMIQCSLELIDCGYDYWDVANKFLRNQLAEQQIKSGRFVSVDNSKKDKDGMTWQDLDKRVVGGWSGGGEPNSISLSRFRAIAGCCVGTAPQALHLMWERIIVDTKEGVYINFPIEKKDKTAEIEIGYPNEGYIKIKTRKEGNYYIRVYDWMGNKIETRLGNKNVPITYSNGCIFFQNAKKGNVLTISHMLKNVVKKEFVQGAEYTITWRGPDVVRIDPSGVPLKLYQREKGAEKEYPEPIMSKKDVVDMKPTEQR